ncbi:MAG TPA: PAS domain S-box protein, partial [Burkholderiaceae bacterium]|nr:PAS domain S-box protein [Burkholderiaceae bacterium]
MPTRIAQLVPRIVVALLTLGFAADASAGSWLDAFGEMDLHRRLWLAALGGFSLAAAFAMLAFELRSRRISIALRRLTDLVATVDGRLREETRRQRVSTELTRLSDEILYTSQRTGRDRRELAAKAASWEAMFAASLEASLALDKAGVVTHVNPAAERLFRVTAQEVIGKPLVDVMLPATHRSPDNASFASDLVGGRASGRRQELVAQRRDGRQFPLEVTVAEFNNGEQIGYVVSARDISAQRRLRAELARAREILPEGSVKPRTAYTLEEICGDPIRRLAARAERKGLRFRYDDAEAQGLALVGNAARLRRVLANLIDSALQVCDAGELNVHVTVIPVEDREVRLCSSVTASEMTDEQAATMMQPYVVQPFASVGPGGAVTDRRIEFFGARVMVARAAGGGVTFQFNQRFEADLSRVTIDLSSNVAQGNESAGNVAPKAEHAPSPAHDAADFTRAAMRLRKNAKKINLGALWAEAHRLTNAWERRAAAGDLNGDTGLVSALAHAARGGDTSSAILLARRLADALERAAAHELDT